MRKTIIVAMISMLGPRLSFADDLPYWAYGFKGPGTPATSAAVTADTSLKRLPGSKFAFNHAQIFNRYGPADWYPEDHPAMPEVVAHGRKPDVTACSLCHYPNGKGRSENAGITGLPVSYFIQALNDFRSGARRSWDSRRTNTKTMIALAKAMTGDEIKQAAEYFGSMKWTPWIRVVETVMVPKTRLDGRAFLVLENGERELLGQRIIETPENAEATQTLRDDHSGFVAYVPVGSINKGKVLVSVHKCDACHGERLTGIGPVPGIAGRSPSYLVRQMYDMQQSTRKGVWSELMGPVVAKLTPADMIAIAAFVSSRKP